ncbi:MAG: VOC family protein [Alphaproteobacteria bacterium]
MIRYGRLGYVELNVTDLERSAEFYQAMVGLEPAGCGPTGEARFRCTDDPYAVVLHGSDAPGLKRVGWMLESEAEFDNAYRVFKQHDIGHEDLSADECAGRDIGRAVRFVEPHAGSTVEFYIPPAGQELRPFEPTLTRIQRLGHVVLATPNYHEAVGFFRDVLNFAESDSIGEGVTFMRAWPNPYHHGLGIGRAEAPTFHHLNFMVTEIDDVGRAFNRARKADVPIVFGPGRHIASNSVFLYFLDPDGMTLEYSFGMEEFPEVGARPPRNLPPKPESIDSWGAIRDPRMSAIGEIERYRVAQASL